MKTFLLVCIIGIVLSVATNISRSQNIFAIVNNDTVTLWEVQATDRNCGAMYQMIIAESDHTLNWYQIDTGLTYVCLCTFDLSVTYGPLEPGNYTANVYYSDAWSPNDTIYEGTAEFTIMSSYREVNSGGILSQYQSDCYDPQGIAEDDEIQSFTIYPIPAITGELIHLEASGFYKDVFLEFYSTSGQMIFSKDYIGKGNITDQWLVKELFPGPGIYIVRLRDSKGIISKLIPVP